MILSLLYLAVSLFGLGILIFVHEWGHYIVGLKMGMNVETFSIGFGRPIKTWRAKNGVLFQLGSIPLGGYVKFKGLEGDRSASDGYYAAPYYKRIIVALAGPVANLLLALFVFVLIFLIGGRSIPFQEKNPFVGFVLPGSSWFKEGLRDGDKIQKINGKTFVSGTDFLVEQTLTKEPVRLEGVHFPLYSQSSFDISGREVAWMPADFLLFNDIPKLIPEELAYLKQKGLKVGDRILSISGMPVFSRQALTLQLQKPTAFLHVLRNGNTIYLRVPKVLLTDLKLSSAQEGELTDWMHAAGLKSLKYFIPYDLTNDLVVSESCEYLNEEALWQKPEQEDLLNPIDQLLLPGDKILACNGKRVSKPQELVSILDKDVFHVIMQKNELKTLTDDKATQEFWAPYLSKDYQDVISSPDMSQSGQIYSFEVPVIKLNMLKLSEAEKARQDKILQDNLEAIGKVKDPKVRARHLKELELEQTRFIIGGKFQDQMIKYNPNPFYEIYNTCLMTFKTIKGLVMGGVSPKQLSGPVAIVGVMQYGAKKSFTEGLYYFAVISINLGLFNLLPLPVLDGGHILFALYEGIFRRPVPQKVMDRLTLVFVVVLIALVIYTTYYDILKFLKGFF